MPDSGAIRHAGFLAASRTRASATDAYRGRPGLLDWLDRLTWRARQRDLERWLARSVDAADLERRLRSAERDLFRRGY